MLDHCEEVLANLEFCLAVFQRIDNTEFGKKWSAQTSITDAEMWSLDNQQEVRAFFAKFDLEASEVETALMAKEMKGSEAEADRIAEPDDVANEAESSEDENFVQV
jgi:hypothetical protein